MNRKLTSFDRLLVLAVSDTYSVLYAGWGNSPPGAIKEDATLITGEIAEQLYAALAGHAFSEHPENACASKSRLGRSWINSRIRNMKLFPGLYDGCNVIMLFSAQAVLRQHHNVIRPWLGVTRLNEHGNPVLDAPEYKPIRIR